MKRLDARPSVRRTTGFAVFIGLSIATVMFANGADLSDQSVEDAKGSPESIAPTAIVVTATNLPLRLKGSDGLVHLEYDLLITNAFTAPVTLTSITVLGEQDEPLLVLSGDELTALVEPILGTSQLSKTAALVPITASVAVVIDVPVRRDAVPKRLSHRIKYSVPADSPAIALIGSYDITGPVLDVSDTEELTIAPPLRGSGWWSLNGCCSPNAHRSLRNAVGGTRLVKPETFAIDYVQLRHGQFFSGDGSKSSQHFAYGADLLAVADGEVVFVRTDMPEELPFLPVTHVKKPVDYAGNQVVLRIGSNAWAIYGHMQTNSATVRVGDRVKVGQVLGRLGNSGNTTAPHLHFEIANNPVNTAATSVPYVFRNYVLQGFVTPTAAATPPDAGGVPISGSPSAQHQTHPLWLTISEFE
jgi:hypothetical protein